MKEKSKKRRKNVAKQRKKSSHFCNVDLSCNVWMVMEHFYASFSTVSCLENMGGAAELLQC